MKIKFTHLLLLFFISNMYSQNLLNSASWVEGTGHVSGFAMYGVSQKNYRELGLNHVGDEVILWKSIPDDTGFQDGGYYSSFVSIDPTKTYRFSVWIKKTNSNVGHTFFGCHSYTSGQHQTLNLNGTTNTNPYFWYGDLPELNKWYLLVGYIHKSSYSSTVSLGRIYDGETTEEVLTITDFKFSTSAINARSRSFLGYDTNSDDRQYLYNPTIEEINGSESSLNQLLGINEGSTLMFGYDTAGNQVKRFYCYNGNCNLPAGRPSSPIIEEIEKITEKEGGEIETLANNIKNITVSPNPTAGMVTIHGDKILSEITSLIMIYDSKGQIIRQIIPQKSSKQEIDLRNTASGLYFIHMHLNDGTEVTKRILKK